MSSPGRGTLNEKKSDQLFRISRERLIGVFTQKDSPILCSKAHSDLYSASRETPSLTAPPEKMIRFLELSRLVLDSGAIRAPAPSGQASNR